MQVLSARLGLSSANPCGSGAGGLLHHAGNAGWTAWAGAAHGCAVDRLWPARLAGGGTASLHAGRDRRRVELAGRRDDARLRDLRQPQLRVKPGQRRVAAGPMGGFYHPQSAGCDAGFGGAQDDECAAGDSFGVRADAARGKRLGSVAADHCGLALRLHHRQSFALRAGSYPDEHLYQAQETVDWVRGKTDGEGGLRA